MHQAQRNAAVTLQTQRVEATGGVFLMNRFMKESSVTALRLLMLADGQRECAFIDNTQAWRRVMMALELAL